MDTKKKNGKRNGKHGGNGNGNGNRNKSGNGNGGESKNNLEWHVENFSEPCEVCGQKMIVHGFRKSGKKFKAVYASCIKEGCPERGKETRFVETSVTTCEVCNKTVSILSVRKSKFNCRRAVYGRCTTEGCREKVIKICFLGAKIFGEETESESGRDPCTIEARA